MTGHSGMAKVEKKAAKRKAETAAKNPKNYVASVGKAFAVLQSFTSEAFELTLSEIAARADLDRGTAFRLIQTLIALGYLQAVPQSRRFRLGLACLDLGYTVLSHGSLRSIVEPMLRGLVPDIGDAASLGILDGGDVVYLARVGAGLDRHKMDRRPGTRIPAYSAALGHVMLAQLSRDEQIARLESRPRLKLSERTLTEARRPARPARPGEEEGLRRFRRRERLWTAYPGNPNLRRAGSRDRRIERYGRRDALGHGGLPRPGVATAGAGDGAGAGSRDQVGVGELRDPFDHHCESAFTTYILEASFRNPISPCEEPC